MDEQTRLAVIGAVVAALGYIGKLLVESVIQLKDRWLERRARLVKLQSLLLTSRSIFLVQRDLADNVSLDVEDRVREKIDAVGYDEILAAAFQFDFLNEQQKAAHGLIRSYTMNAIRPLNSKMMDWLSEDTYYKSKDGKLGEALRRLEAHLVLWQSKYDFWIPPNPERVLVFLADEHNHGIGFPTGIETLLAKVTGGIGGRVTTPAATVEPR